MLISLFVCYLTEGHDLQAVQLEDGSTAFIQTQVPTDFTDHTHGKSI